MSVLYTDIDPFCCEVLKARVADGGLLPGEVWCRDIKTVGPADLRPFRQVHLFAGIGGSPLGFKWAGWPSGWSLVTGGFPCQSISTAGKRLGEADARFLWPEMYRVVDIVRPDWVFVENSPNLRTLGADTVLGDLERAGYSATPIVVGSQDLGTPMRSKRAWIVASSVRVGRSQAVHKRGVYSPGGDWEATHAQRPVRHARTPGPGAVSQIPRGTHGLPKGVVRNRGRQVHALGNSQDPRVVEIIARSMMTMLIPKEESAR